MATKVSKLHIDWPAVDLKTGKLTQRMSQYLEGLRTRSGGDFDAVDNLNVIDAPTTSAGLALEAAMRAEMKANQALLQTANENILKLESFVIAQVSRISSLENELNQLKSTRTSVPVLVEELKQEINNLKVMQHA